MELKDKFEGMIQWLRVEAFEVNRSVLRESMGSADRDFARSRSTMFTLAADLIDHSLKSVSDLQKLVLSGKDLINEAEQRLRIASEHAELAKALLEDCRPIIEAHGEGTSSPELQSYARLLSARLDALFGTGTKGV